MIPVTDAALCITFPLLAILAVIGRFAARRVQSISFLADDWAILFPLFCAIVTGVLGLVGAVYGGFGAKQPIGPDGFPAKNSQLVVFDKESCISFITYVSQIIGIGALCGSKLSVLLLYKRIFAAPSSTFRMAFIVMFSVNAFWGFAYFMVYLLRCVPISDAWTTNYGTPRRCIPNNDAEYSYAVTNCILDAAILAMPMPMVWNLQLPVRQKVGVSAIFLLGLIVIGIGIAKTIAFFDFGAVYKSNHQGIYDGTVLFYYTVPENCLAVVAACLPTLRPLFQGFSPESIIGSIRSAISLRSREAKSENKSRFSHQNQGGESAVCFSKISEDLPLSIETTSNPTKRHWIESRGEIARSAVALQDWSAGGGITDKL